MPRFLLLKLLLLLLCTASYAQGFASGQYTADYYTFKVPAYLIYALLPLGGLWLAFYYYRRKAFAAKHNTSQLAQKEEDKFKIDLLTDLTHELRTPLALMLTQLKKIEESENIVEIKQNVKLVQQSTNKLISLTNRLPGLGKAEIDDPEQLALKEDTAESLPVDIDTDEPQKSSILLVEDNDEIAEFLARSLKGEYTVIHAHNGQTGLELLEYNIVELVISDIMMPVMNGYELCRQIKTNADLSHIPVMLLSAKNSVEAKIEGLNCGADVYIEKPFTLKHLTAQIASLLLNRQKVKTHYAQSPAANLGDIAYSTADKAFLEKLNDSVLAHIANPEFEVGQLADMLNMSRRNMFRKVKGITGMAPLELINVIRLKRAAEMLLQDDVRVYEVADMVGFNSRGVFTRKFTRQFNMSPTEYVKQNQAAASRPAYAAEN